MVYKVRFENGKNVFSWFQVVGPSERVRIFFGRLSRLMGHTGCEAILLRTCGWANEGPFK